MVGAKRQKRSSARRHAIILCVHTICMHKYLYIYQEIIMSSRYYYKWVNREIMAELRAIVLDKKKRANIHFRISNLVVTDN